MSSGDAKKYYQSPNVHVWSAIPVALLSIFVNFSEKKQGSGFKVYNVFVEFRGTFVSKFN